MMLFFQSVLLIEALEAAYFMSTTAFAFLRHRFLGLVRASALTIFGLLGFRRTVIGLTQAKAGATYLAAASQECRRILRSTLVSGRRFTARLVRRCLLIFLLIDIVVRDTLTLSFVAVFDTAVLADH